MEGIFAHPFDAPVAGKSAHEVTFEAVQAYVSGSLFIGDVLRVLQAQHEHSEEAQRSCQSLLEDPAGVRPCLKLCVDDAVSAIVRYREVLFVLLGDVLVFNLEGPPRLLPILHQRSRDVRAAYRRLTMVIRAGRTETLVDLAA